MFSGFSPNCSWLHHLRGVTWCSEVKGHSTPRGLKFAKICPMTYEQWQEACCSQIPEEFDPRRDLSDWHANPFPYSPAADRAAEEAGKEKQEHGRQKVYLRCQGCWQPTTWPPGLHRKIHKGIQWRWQRTVLRQWLHLGSDGPHG